jgi:hypothetical protein
MKKQEKEPMDMQLSLGLPITERKTKTRPNDKKTKVNKPEKIPPKSLEKKPNTVFEMKVIFDEFYKESSGGISFNWGGAKTPEAGKHFGNLKRLCEALKYSVLSHKSHLNSTQLNTIAEECTDEEILNAWRYFLKNLPEYHRKINCDPSLIFSNYNRIIIEIKNQSNNKDKRDTGGGIKIKDLRPEDFI